MGTLEAITRTDTIKTLTTHYIDGAFVESHGREVMDIINPTNGQEIARVTLADEEDARRAIAAAKRAFASFGRTPKEERMEILRRLHQAVSARIDDLTKTMVEEYGGVVRFAGPIVQAGADVFLAAERALHELPLTRSWGKTTVTMEPVGVAGLISPWNADAFFLCMKLASAVAAGCTVVMKPSELSFCKRACGWNVYTRRNFRKGFATLSRVGERSSERNSCGIPTWPRFPLPARPPSEDRSCATGLRR
jgi:acyl-CoA reductase-like NAD-dependent aldehyde dehydrogenase